MIKYIILTTVIVLIIALVIIYYFAAGIGQLKKGKKEVKVPGLSDGFVPQGLAYYEKENKLLVSGYMKNGKPTRVYVLDKRSKMSEKFVAFETEDKEAFVGHAGGIAIFGDFGYISSEGMIFRFKLNELALAKNGEVITFDYHFQTGTGADFCFVDKGLLYVGEFYKMGKFKTDINHHILLENEKGHFAIVFAFRISGNGVPNSIPEKALSIPDMVQGMLVFHGKFYFSVSYGLSKSKLYEYENILQKSTKRSIVYKDKNIPLWIFEDRFLKKTYTLPPMSEGIAEVDDKIFILFESASKKYKYFMRTRLKDIYSLKIN